MLSKLLIQDKFEEFNEYEYEYKNLSQSIYEKNMKNKTKYLNQIKKKSNDSFTDEINSFTNEIDIVELCDDKNYIIYDNEVKYKIFEDISSICKSNCGNLELILCIPYGNNIVSINKIKLSCGLSKYIKNIHLMTENKVIMKKENLLNNNNKIFKIIENTDKINNKSYHPNNNNIRLHIILDKDSLNYIINKNIFVNYSYTIPKNKFKFI